MQTALLSKKHGARWNELKPTIVKVETGLRNIYSRVSFLAK
jgi:hypothetical protein